MNDEVDSAVIVERLTDHVALVTLNRPHVHNAINGDMARQLHAATVEIENDPAIRVAILTARGPSFCAGLDLKVVSEGKVDEVVIGEAGFAGFVFATKSKPWIAAVHGKALGGGTEIALACDLIVAGEAATFALPEVKRGLIAGAGGCIRIAGRLPRSVAVEMVTLGTQLSAARAYDLGMANRLVPAGTEVGAALEMAMIISQNAPTAVRQSLRLTRLAADQNEAELLAAQAGAVEIILSSPDMLEGARAFTEKRAPVWAP